MTNPIIQYYESGQKHAEIWFLNDRKHRIDGPACQEWSESGQKGQEIWFLNGYNLQNEPLKSWLKENKITNLCYDTWTETQQILFKLTWGGQK
ncbi:hypothetical protein DF3PA_70105 [Candidatus Defluviicoccus seviourii]|uniref:Uncharacterized protein n=1 Tax=Candidatus Defluviicoccus seviourii TaxID=2565273 RepID=A0A564WJG7_9PROT|nr:hypothetical protein DF3PA_70105 [Candidatus Defluviicoccus seviourii]